MSPTARPPVTTPTGCTRRPRPSPAVVAMVIDILTALSSASAKGAGRRLADRERLASELGLYLLP